MRRRRTLLLSLIGFCCLWMTIQLQLTFLGGKYGYIIQKYVNGGSTSDLDIVSFQPGNIKAVAVMHPGN
jgi:hypothetical protein